MLSEIIWFEKNDFGVSAAADGGRIEGEERVLEIEPLFRCPVRCLAAGFSRVTATRFSGKNLTK